MQTSRWKVAINQVDPIVQDQDTAGNARDVLYTQAEDSAGRYMLQVVRAVDAKTFVRLAGRQGYEYLSTLSFIRGVATSTVSR